MIHHVRREGLLIVNDEIETVDIRGWTVLRLRPGRALRQLKKSVGRFDNSRNDW